MHVAAGLFLAAAALLLLLAVAGATPFVGIPVAVVLFLVPFAWAALTAGKAADRGRSVDKSGVPTTRQASYKPATDPTERP
ncbi:MAG: hypothetical protein QOJ97_1581 [Solirubrobacteraceae bacterium]|jgi:hypothetical protein|nr:hypothetical protein [Solirubrobacteraceae bacterium]